MLLLRLSGLLLLRFAARTLLGLLFHEPPRRDRLGLWSAPPAKNSTPKDHPPQALRLRVPCVADPALHGGVEILPVQPPRCVAFRKATKLAGKAMAIVVAQSATTGKDVVTQQINTSAMLQ